MLRTLKWVPIFQGFSHFLRFFSSFRKGQISQQQHKGLSELYEDEEEMLPVEQLL